jgi:chromosome segregation ATPase
MRNLKENINFTEDYEEKKVLAKEYEVLFHSQNDLDTQIKQLETDYDALKKQHNQERSQLKRDDEAAAEIERKNQEFNENAGRVIETYMGLESEKSKFESRMSDKEAEM